MKKLYCGSVTGHAMGVIDKCGEITYGGDLYQCKGCKIKELEVKEKKLKEAISDLIFHFHDYGMSSESLACLMAVNKTEQLFKELYDE